jgi:nucleoside-diphosphate-sugar epimerase
MNCIINGIYQTIPNLFLPVVDIRNAAEAHFKAVFKEGINNQRFVIMQEIIKMQDIAKNIIQKNFAQYGYNVQTKPIEDDSHLSPFLKHYNNVEYSFVNTKSKEVLGMEYKDYTME